MQCKRNVSRRLNFTVWRFRFDIMTGICWAQGMKSQSLRAKILAILSCVIALHAQAGSATWNPSPTSGDWNTAANWTPHTIPDAATDTATFATSATTAISLSSAVTVNSIVFNSGASSFSVAANPTKFLTISGSGIANNSAMTQHFLVNQDDSGNFNGISFANTARAGTNTMFTVQGGTGPYGSAGQIFFNGRSSADHATFQTTPSTSDSFSNAGLSFTESSTAADATFTLDGGDMFFGSNATAGDATIDIKNGGLVFFSLSASGGNSTISLNASSLIMAPNANASNATFIANGSTTSGGVVGSMLFGNGPGSPTAGNATLIANPGSNGGFGGIIIFEDTSLGGTSRIEVFGNGRMDISSHTGPGFTIGSLEGDGQVFLGARNLSVGGNGLSTSFSGVIKDGGRGGSLSKIGADTLTLSGANIYTGSTTVSAGTLVIANTSGSATGTGPVRVNVGTLGGSGTASGAVTVGTGSGAEAFLAPAAGTNKQATLTIQSGLTFNADAVYTYTFKAKKNKAKTDKVVADGVTINGASFAFQGTAQGTLKTGLTLTAISNTAAMPITGTFSNLPDGAILTASGNNFQASYAGGDGNDLTLTVVP